MIHKNLVKMQLHKKKAGHPIMNYIRVICLLFSVAGSHYTYKIHIEIFHKKILAILFIIIS